LKNSQWIDIDCEIPSEAFPLIFWNGEQNPRNLIENIFLSASQVSKVPRERMKEIVSAAVINEIRKIYPTFEFTIVFDDNDILQVNHDNHNFLYALSSGDLVILWLSIMTVIRKSTKYHLPLILDSPFSRLNVLDRTIILNLLKEAVCGGQLIFICSEMEFKHVFPTLKSIMKTQYHLGN
jgi:hypothetical protein